MGQSRSSVEYEIIRYSPYWDSEGWKEVQLALEGRRCEPFSVHRSALEMFGGEDNEAWWAYLSRSARAVTEQAVLT
jgi:hypothetical protein